MIVLLTMVCNALLNTETVVRCHLNRTHDSYEGTYQAMNFVVTRHLSAVRKWGGKTSDYAKSRGAKPKIHGKCK